MISVIDAEKIVLASVRPFPVVSVPLKEACGLVLREHLISDRPQPPFHKATMDGIAICFESWQKGQRCFTVQDTIAAGQKSSALKKADACVRIMTGGVIPEGCDCVIPVEQLDEEEEGIQLKDWTVINAKQNIRFQGTDRKKGDVLLKAGCVLLPPHIGTAASIGKAKIKVSAKPKVAIVATGDELVDIDKPLKLHQTRLSNSYALRALFEQNHLADVEMFHFRDDKNLLLRQLKNILSKFDALVLSGGVSMGEFDYVPQVLSALRVKVLFHTVAQKPGKPFWFGKTKNDKPVFALPGNPVSTQICAYRYVVPYFKKALGLRLENKYAVLAEYFNPKTDLTYFLPVRTREESGIRYAYPVDIGGSGDFTALAQADGFVELLSSTDQFKKGEKVMYYAWS